MNDTDGAHHIILMNTHQANAEQASRAAVCALRQLEQLEGSESRHQCPRVKACRNSMQAGVPYGVTEGVVMS